VGDPPAQLVAEALELTSGGQWCVIGHGQEGKPIAADVERGGAGGAPPRFI
jgi:hypothetical protein